MKRETRLLTLLGIAVALAALVGCGGAVYEVEGTSRTVGTDAVITADEIEGGNVGVALEVSHLPPPDRLGEGLTTYVVWFTRRDGETRKAGILGYDPDDRRGRMQATSPDRRFNLRVTAEQSRNASAPSDVLVLEKEVNIDE